MSFGELITIVGDVVEPKSHGSGVSMSSYLNNERRYGTKIGELITIGEVSNPGSHGDQASLMWIMKVIGDVRFTVTRRFWSDKKVENLYLISCPPTRYAEVKAVSSSKSRKVVQL